jgi:hypothetical protein
MIVLRHDEILIEIVWMHRTRIAQIKTLPAYMYLPDIPGKLSPPKKEVVAKSQSFNHLTSFKALIPCTKIASLAKDL